MEQAGWRRLERPSLLGDNGAVYWLYEATGKRTKEADARDHWRDQGTTPPPF